MLFRRSLILATCLLATACADSKFPYPPQFVSTDDVSVAALPTPPAADSKKFKNELNQIVALQKKLTQKEKNTIAEEGPVVPEMIVLPVLGKNYSEAKYPALYTLLRHVGSDSWRISDAAKEHWKAPRPFHVDNRIQPYAEPLKSYGYPSGHTTTGHVWAGVLSEIFPAKKAALTKRAGQIAQHRVSGGLHFPYDVAGGKTLAATIVAKLKNNPDYQHELAAAKAELKSPAVKSQKMAGGGVATCDRQVRAVSGATTNVMQAGGC